MPLECDIEKQEPGKSIPLGPIKDACCFLPGSIIRGTVFFGGAGLDGKYIKDMVTAFREKGIRSAQYVDSKKWSSGKITDAVLGVRALSEEMPRFPMRLRKLKGFGCQFNLIGYSFGSLAAAQLAAIYARRHTVVDHLVLIGSPISKRFLNTLKNLPNIKKVIVINLTEHDDPLYAGMPYYKVALSAFKLQSQMERGTGHFYYAPSSSEGKKRRRELATTLFKLGLRQYDETP